MKIQEHLSTSLGRKDQGPNHQLASEIAAGRESIQDLIDFFNTRPHRDLQKDAIITIAYVSEISPELVTPYFNLLLINLDSKINRVVYGSMMALSRMVEFIPDRMYEALPKVIDTMHEGSVVTRDYGFKILAQLYADKSYRNDVFPLALEEIQLAPDNQLGQYTERLMIELEEDHRPVLRSVLEERRNEIVNPSHIKRLDKNLKRL